MGLARFKGQRQLQAIWEFPKIRGTLFGVLIIRILYYLGYYVRVPYFRKLPYRIFSG